MDILFECVCREQGRRINLLWAQKPLSYLEVCWRLQWYTKVILCIICISPHCHKPGEGKGRKVSLAAQGKSGWSISPSNKNPSISETGRVDPFFHQTEDPHRSRMSAPYGTLVASTPSRPWSRSPPRSTWCPGAENCHYSLAFFQSKVKQWEGYVTACQCGVSTAQRWGIVLSALVRAYVEIFKGAEFS